MPSNQSTHDPSPGAPASNHLLGYQMPAEWDSHAATLLSWPHNQETWPNNLAAAQAEFLELALAIASDEPVYILASEANAPRLPSSSPLKILPVPTNDAWLRDYGPTYVMSADRSSRIAIDWQYNAWGGKYPPYDLDQQAVSKILSCNVHDRCHYSAVRYTSHLCIEGGAMEVNGNGLLLTTQSCALDKNRNPNSSPESVENELRKNLGVETVIWLNGGSIIGDDTDGHVDQLARFVSHDHLVFCAASDPRDPQGAALENNRLCLKLALERLGTKFQLTPIPLPSPVVMFGDRLPASYCNFYITNHSVVVPQFNDKIADARALKILTEHFPTRNVFGLPSNNLTVGLGSFHCLTQQVPTIG